MQLILIFLLCLIRASGANRSLPDIPKDKNVDMDGEVQSAPRDVIYEAAETIGDPSELYATVQDKNGRQIFVID